MDKSEHIKRHKELHKAFDELLADAIEHGNFIPTRDTIFELIRWSYTQCNEKTIDHESKK